jgi:hypothetical protein
MPQLQDRKIWEARKIPVTQPEPPTKVHEAKPDPRPPAVTFVTTEHFVLQGARSSTIAESSGRANMFLAAVSGGLVALGLVATASNRDQRHRSRTPGACDLGERWPTQRPVIRMTRDGSLMCGPPRPVSAQGKGSSLHRSRTRGATRTGPRAIGQLLRPTRGKATSRKPRGWLRVSLGLPIASSRFPSSAPSRRSDYPPRRARTTGRRWRLRPRRWRRRASGRPRRGRAGGRCR